MVRRDPRQTAPAPVNGAEKVGHWGARARLADLAQLAEAGRLQELFEQAIAQRMNILVWGSTSSGKTTVARALLSLADRGERLVTIEDARELHLPYPNSVALIAERDAASERTHTKLLMAALRMRPDRLILGEMRGEEALAFLDAINTGHPDQHDPCRQSGPRARAAGADGHAHRHAAVPAGRP